MIEYLFYIEEAEIVVKYLDEVFSKLDNLDDVPYSVFRFNSLLKHFIDKYYDSSDVTI